MKYVIVSMSDMEKCIDCPAICCSVAGEVILTRKDFDRIQEEVDITDKINTSTLTIIKGKGEVCPFLNNNNECSIYEIRPEVCQDYDCEDDEAVKNVRDQLLNG